MSAFASTGHAAHIGLGSFVPIPDSRSAAKASSFDHLVGGHEQLVRHSEAEHPGGRGVDDQLELTRLHDRQISRLRALEDAAGVGADLTPRIPQARTVAHQPIRLGS